MLGTDISKIIGFLDSRKVLATEPGEELYHCLEDSETISKTGLLVYDFEANRLFFANARASDFLGIKSEDFNRYDGVFLESIIHPVSYQFMQYNIRLNKPGLDENFNGAYYLRTSGKSKYAWVYASGKVMSSNAAGVPGLIYVCFVEVEKAMECYLKILHGRSNPAQLPDSAALLLSLKTREVEMLSLVVAECSSKEIAYKLNMTQPALDGARKRLIRKLGVKSVAGLVKVALSLGISGEETPATMHSGLRRVIGSRTSGSLKIAG